MTMYKWSSNWNEENVGKWKRIIREDYIILNINLNMMHEYKIIWS